MDAFAFVAARGHQLVATALLRLGDDALNQRGADVAAPVVRFDEDVLHEAERPVVELVPQDVEEGAADDLPFHGAGDEDAGGRRPRDRQMHARHVGSFHPVRTDQLPVFPGSGAMGMACSRTASRGSRSFAAGSPMSASTTYDESA